MSGKAHLTPFVLALFASAASAAYDMNDITLGASERDIRQRLANAHCRELEWPSRAAERRCDDSRINFGGVDASVTFYLKSGAVEGFDVRFDQRELARVKDFLVKRYGKPASERETPPVVDWQANGERARLSAEQGRRRASLFVWRGAFDQEIYKIR